MGGNHCIRHSAKSVLLIVTLSLLSHALADLSVTPSDATVARGQSVLFQCEPRDVNIDYGITWTMYDDDPPKTQKLFTVTGGQQGGQPQVTYLPGVDQNKFSRNGTYNLLVRNVDLNDSAVYACAPIAGQNSYANLIVIGDLNISTSPSRDVQIGSSITITCTLTYSGPNSTNNYKPLTPDQDPNLKILVGNHDLNAAVYKQPGGIKTASVNTTVTQDYINAEVVCEVTSEGVSQNFRIRKSASIGVPTPPSDIQKTAIGNSTDDVRVGYSVNCTAKGNPPPVVKWQEVTQGVINLSPNTFGPGWAKLTFGTARENQEWNCTATSAATSMASNNGSLAQISKVFTFDVKTLEGQSVSGAPSCLIHETQLLKMFAILFALLCLTV